MRMHDATNNNIVVRSVRLISFGHTAHTPELDPTTNIVLSPMLTITSITRIYPLPIESMKM